MNLYNFEMHKAFSSLVRKHNSSQFVTMWTLAPQAEILETSFTHPDRGHMGHTKRTSFGMACGHGKLAEEHWERKNAGPT